MVKIIRVAVVLFLVLLLSVPNVFAAWVYFTNPPAPATTNLQTKIFEFKEYRGVYIKSIERISHSNLQLTKTDISIPAVIMNEVKINTKTIGLMLFKITFAEIPPSMISDKVKKRRNKYETGLAATKTDTINRTARIILVRGSSLCKTDVPGKN